VITFWNVVLIVFMIYWVRGVVPRLSELYDYFLLTRQHMIMSHKDDKDAIKNVKKATRGALIISGVSVLFFPITEPILALIFKEDKQM